MFSYLDLFEAIWKFSYYSGLSLLRLFLHFPLFILFLFFLLNIYFLRFLPFLFFLLFILFPLFLLLPAFLHFLLGLVTDWLPWPPRPQIRNLFYVRHVSDSFRLMSSVQWRTWLTTATSIVESLQVKQEVVSAVVSEAVSRVQSPD